jgi:hypothetical protein
MRDEESRALRSNDLFHSAGNSISLESEESCVSSYLFFLFIRRPSHVERRSRRSAYDVLTTLYRRCILVCHWIPREQDYFLAFLSLVSRTVLAQYIKYRIITGRPSGYVNVIGNPKRHDIMLEFSHSAGTTNLG